MRSLERVNIRTNVRTYVLTYIRTGQTLYPLHNFVVRGDNNNQHVISTDMTNPQTSISVNMLYFCPRNNPIVTVSNKLSKKVFTVFN